MNSFSFGHCGLANREEGLDELPEWLHPKKEDYWINGGVQRDQVNKCYVPDVPAHKCFVFIVIVGIFFPSFVISDYYMGVETVVYKKWQVADQIHTGYNDDSYCCLGLGYSREILSAGRAGGFSKFEDREDKTERDWQDGKSKNHSSVVCVEIPKLGIIGSEVTVSRSVCVTYDTINFRGVIIRHYESDS